MVWSVKYTLLIKTPFSFLLFLINVWGHHRSIAITSVLESVTAWDRSHMTSVCLSMVSLPVDKGALCWTWVAMERIIHCKIVDILNKHNRQYGLWPYHSTSSLLLIRANHWVSTEHHSIQYKLCISWFCYIATGHPSFNSVPHEWLLLKLQSTGIGYKDFNRLPVWTHETNSNKHVIL